MKKLLMAMALAGAAMVASAEDSFLYWMVDVGSTENYKFNYATIKAANESGSTSGYLSLYGSDSAEPLGTKLYAANYGVDKKYDPGSTTGYGAFAGVGGYGMGSRFLVELWTDGATASDPANRVAFGWLTYDAVKDSIFAAGNMSGASPFTVGSTMLVPEPTGGLLTLLGLAVLALRRKQKVA